jgi:hypothetical protein
MRIPPVTDRINADRIKEAPAHALRAVFAGVGQLLVVADKIRKQGQNRADPPPAAPRSQPAAQPAPAQPPAGRSLDQTGNVRLLSAEDLADEPAAAAAVVALPVPNYDSLSLPSLRARLRTLNAAQLRELIEYEQAHAARADVVAMFERRIAKLAAEG